MLDKKDYKILAALDQDCRQPLSQLAKKLRINRDVLTYRIKRLEEAGIIEGYLALIDFGKIGYKLIRLYIKLQNTTAAIEEEMVNYILEQKDVATVYNIDGKYNIAIGFLVKDIAEYEQPYYKILDKYNEYIIEKDFSVFIDLINYHRGYLTDEKPEIVMHVGRGPSCSVDEEDLQLLSILAKDARASLIQLSKELKLTPNAVKYRLQQLKKQNIIVAYRAAINQRKLGYTYYKIDLELEDTKIIPALDQYCKQHNNVVYQDICVGGGDFEFDVELKDKTAFYAFMNELRAAFPEKIRSYRYYEAIRIYKWDYFPKSALQ